MQIAIAGLLAVLVAASPSLAAPPVPRCPPPQATGYRPKPTAGRNAPRPPLLTAGIIHDCLMDDTVLTGPVRHKLSASPTFRDIRPPG